MRRTERVRARRAPLSPPDFGRKGAILNPDWADLDILDPLERNPEVPRAQVVVAWCLGGESNPHGLAAIGF